MAYVYRYGYEEEKTPPPPKMATNRNVWKLYLLSILTLGFYGVFFFGTFSGDLNKIAPRRGGEKTMNYLVAYLLSLFTYSIVLMFWHYQVADHIEEALALRKIECSFSKEKFWIFCVIIGLIPFVSLIGTAVYYYYLCDAMNRLSADYNERPYVDGDKTYAR